MNWIIRIIILVLMGLFYSCKPDLIIDTLDIEKSSWDQVQLKIKYKDEAWHNFNSSKEYNPNRLLISLFRSNGDLVKTFDTCQLVFDDREFENQEKLKIQIVSNFESGDIVKDTFFFASPKKTAIYHNIEFPINKNRNSFGYELHLFLQRQKFGQMTYENIKPLPTAGTIEVKVGSDGFNEKFHLYQLKDTLFFSDDNTQFINRLLQEKDRINVRFKYALEMNQEIQDTIIDRTVFVDPEFSTCIDGYRYEYSHRLHSAQYGKIYVPRNKIVVLTYNGKYQTDDIDLIVYNGRDLEEIKMQTSNTGKKDILYFLGSGGYEYFKVINRTDQNIDVTLNTHIIKYEEIITQTAIEYSMQYVVKELLNSLFGVSDDNQIGNNFSDTAANVVISAINGNNQQGLTKNAVVNSTVGAIRSTFGHGELTNFLIACVINIFNSIYFFY